MSCCKRPSSPNVVSYKDYVPCVFCKGYLLSTEIWRHYTDCKFKNEDLTVDDEECRTNLSVENLRSSRILAESMSKGIDRYAELFANMRMDNIAFVAKQDDIISKLGSNLYHKKGSEQLGYIRAKMREISRILIRLKENSQNENLTLKDVLTPDYFDGVINAVLGECKYSSENGTPNFDIPSLALKVGHTLRKCCCIKLSFCIRARDVQGESDAEQFIKMLNMEFTDRVSSIALQTLVSMKRKKTKVSSCDRGYC